MNRRAAGFTLLELVVAMAVFGIFLYILMTLTAEMRKYENRLPINFMKHPQVSAVVARLRRDVWDADSGTTTPYVSQWPEQNPRYFNGKQVLIIRVVELGGRRTVVWDFREPGIVTRRSYNVGIATDWVARGLPADIQSFEIDAEEIANRGYAVRLIAKDKKLRTAIDQIFLPRAHQ